MAGVTDYRDALLALMPQGDAWPTDPDSELGKLLTGLAEEFARIDARAEELLNESHPSQTFELFEEWEQMYGLPDTCAGTDPSFQERRFDLVQRYRQLGGQSRQFFIEMAAALGYEITITEYQERSFGMDHGTDFGGTDWNFAWQINATQANYAERSMGDPFGEYYREWGNQRLECALSRLRHAHRKLIFSYS
jgi:uncharacterized protein YmfQ (DUF2313 family)